ncbi:MAG: DNA translocase FtsK [Bacteroidota bacterium]|nr:DNA translocase FtsK [Bacteroidota bacterium]
MSKATKKEVKDKPTPKNNRSRNKMIIGVIMILFSFAILLSFLSFFIHGNADQSILSEFNNREQTAKNWLGKFGSALSNAFVYNGFGISSFLFVKIFFLTGTYLFLDISLIKLKNSWFWDLYLIITISILLGFFSQNAPELGGVFGFEINSFLQDYIGRIGIVLLLLLFVCTYLVFRIKVSPEKIIRFFKTQKDKIQSEFDKAKATNHTEQAVQKNDSNTNTPTPVTNSKSTNNIINTNISEIKSENKHENDTIHTPKITKPEIKTEIIKPKAETEPSEELIPTTSEITLSIENQQDSTETPSVKEEFVVEQLPDEDILEENLASKLVEDFGEFDPTLELSNFQFPPIDLLKDFPTNAITINQSELEENKNRIVETLKHYKIDIAQIKASVGPTVTLYEIVPEAGIRISKIKSLEDDIALSLSALGIRIIAPIPGKGTIGIEVPNQNPAIVPMKAVITSPKFQTAEMELPIALGKTISNETFVVDLAKMPHLLMAGATGQGKSVGLNAVLTSLLYKKHPAEVKFVLVDPKKVELTLFNNIERHYLAKLPDSEDAIITDNSKVINTLNSLCIEMDNRYELLKDAAVRNIKEYNNKFKKRLLNPEKGHRFLPYIVLVVDEFADLIMTAGKEVETPIARLAQLARAIGIHLIIATQRPSVNVITGIIKANFPARIAFRVTSKIDSKTILDGSGADQLIGRGDLLYTQGNDLVRVQCAFVDTPEVEKICEFIGGQRAYPNAYLLPEYVGEESGTSIDIDISERDALFREAAEIVVTSQQGSTSLIQRKLKLGYNRAGRLIDQLEAAGIVGAFEGSKARAVLIPDLVALEHFLENEQNKN